MSDLKSCPFCGDQPNTFKYNGTMQAQCGKDHKECAGSDVCAPVAMWNTRSIDSKLDTAMKLLRDNQSPMHLDRELNQADHDILREARKWR